MKEEFVQSELQKTQIQKENILENSLTNWKNNFYMNLMVVSLNRLVIV